MLWAVESGQKLLTFDRLFANDKGLQSLSGVEFCAGGKKILTMLNRDRQPSVVQWDARTGERLNGFGGDTAQPVIFGNPISPDGSEIVTKSKAHPGQVVFWNAQTGKKVRTFETGGRIDSVAFSSDGTTLLIGSSVAIDTVALWDVKTGKHLRRIDAGTKVVSRSAAFVLDGRLILTTDWDGRMILWDPATGKREATLIALNASKYDWLIFTPDGHYDGSPEGRKLVTFRVAPGEPLVPGEQLAKDYYRPGLLAKILTGKSRE